MQFKYIVGQKDVKNQLIRAAKEKRISHAQLFYGPPGSGKLPLAIALAQYLSCENPSDNDSCGECASCKKFEKLIHPDLHFVFPVINSGSGQSVSDNFIEKWREILLDSPYFTFQQWLSKLNSENKQASIYKDEAGNIIKKMNLKSFESEYKFMIIWLPEKMNNTAANKLLKMIEEPPPKTVFILVSENINNILPTIASRTIPVKIPSINRDELAGWIMDNYNTNETDAANISRLSRGNLSEAINHFETSESRSENIEIMHTWLSALSKKDIIACVKWADEIGSSNRERQKSLLKYSLRFFREILMKRTKNQSLYFLLEEEEQLASEFMNKINLKKIFRIQEEVETAYYHIERNGAANIILLDLSFKLIRLIQK